MTRDRSDQHCTQVEKNLRYTFRNRRLLSEALTHKSHYHEQKNKADLHNERLEFLGDSVIGLIIVELLFLHEKTFSEAVLAKIKSYIVSEPVFAAVAQELNLGDCLLLGKGERSTGGAEKKSILADTLEAVIGAVYLDSSFEEVRVLVRRLFLERVHNAIRSGDFFDYKTELQERTQMLFGLLPRYEVLREEGPEHERVYTVSVCLDGKPLGIASGRRKKEAEAVAAKKALEQLSGSAEIGKFDMNPQIPPL